MLRLQLAPGKVTVLMMSILLMHAYIHAQKPNIIYIMTDDMGYGDLSCYGQKKYTTPNIDKLASQGIRFMNAYAAAPLCTPTRTALMTGRYPARTPVGLIEPLTGSKKDMDFGLTAEYPSIATLLKDAGYETALIGKWHLGFLSQHNPNNNGFDYFFGIHSGAADYASHKGDLGKPDLYENDRAVEEKGYLTDLIAQKATKYLTQHHSKPFFLAITFNAPHWPWQAPGDQPYNDTMDFRRGGSPEIYQSMMKSLDDAVGNIMQALDDQQLAARTIVIFTNDNGGERYSDHGGLAKAKGTLWEGGIKVPAFVRWTGKIKPGTSTDQQAITMDWTKTILSAAGGSSHKDFSFDGIDLMPIMTAKKKEIERSFYWRTTQRTKQKAIIEGKYKYLQDEKGEYLFNLSNDPGETTDIKAKEEIVFKKLKQKYAAWEKTVLQPIPL